MSFHDAIVMTTVSQCCISALKHNKSWCNIVSIALFKETSISYKEATYTHGTMYMPFLGRWVAEEPRLLL